MSNEKLEELIKTIITEIKKIDNPCRAGHIYQYGGQIIFCTKCGETKKISEQIGFQQERT